MLHCLRNLCVYKKITHQKYFQIIIKGDRNANALDSKEERKIFLYLSDITFGLTLF